MVDRPSLRAAPSISLVVVTAVVAVSCTSSSETEAAPEPTQTTTSTTVITTTSPATTRPSVTVATTTLPPSTTTQPPSTTTTLAGVPYNGPGPRVGDLVAVVGVDHDDVLMVRKGPGISYVAAGSVVPTATEISVTGQARLVKTSLWYEISTPDIQGWVSGAFIGLPGAIDDATLEVYGMLGSPLGDDDLAALGATIAFTFLSEEGGGWIALVEPSEGGSPTAISSITYDVIGIADDAVKGYRLVIHATQAVDDGPYTLHSVERTNICWRGIDSDDLCV